MPKKRRGQSAAFMARIRKLRKSSKRKVYKVRSTLKSMARRRKSRSKSFRRVRRRGSRGFGGSTTNELIGVSGYLLYKSFLSPRIPIADNQKQLAELGLGWYFSKKSGVLGNIGKAMFMISAYQLMVNYIAPHLGGSGSGSIQYY